jgi:hypothetical protein
LNIFPAVAHPELMARRIISRDKDDGSFNSGSAQTGDAFADGVNTTLYLDPNTWLTTRRRARTHSILISIRRRAQDQGRV